MLGLGFQREKMDAPMSAVAGWHASIGARTDGALRSRVARRAHQPLDLDTTLWLQTWLQAYRGTLLTISHDRDFIDVTCEHAGDRAPSADRYRGGYSAASASAPSRWLNSRPSSRNNSDASPTLKTSCCSAKATKVRQAQSRLKELERMQKVAQAHIDSPFSFNFPPPGKVSDPLLTLSDAALGHGEYRVLSKVSVSLSPGDRIGLLGKNGAGKTTLLKSLTGELPLMAGERTEGAHLQIAYFDQQQLGSTSTPVRFCTRSGSHPKRGSGDSRFSGRL